jgi:hypothetical protein
MERATTSRQRRLCEPCAVEVFTASELPEWAKALAVVGVYMATEMEPEGPCAHCGAVRPLVAEILDD